MKHLLLSITMLVVLLSHAMAQAPELFNYQGVARDASGSPLANQSISVQLSVLTGSSSGTAQYVERHTVTTNDFGLFSLKIGNGTVQSGTMNSITWDNGDKYIKVEFDPAGGTAFLNMGTSQLLSVPYALNAGNTHWAKKGNDITNTNNGGVVLDGTNHPGVNQLTLGNHFTNSTPLEIIDSVGNSGNTNSIAVSRYGHAAAGTAVKITGNQDGLSSYSSEQSAARLVSNGDNYPTLNVHHQRNQRAINVDKGRVVIGNWSVYDTCLLEVVDTSSNYSPVYAYSKKATGGVFESLKSHGVAGVSWSADTTKSLAGVAGFAYGNRIGVLGNGGFSGIGGYFIGGGYVNNTYSLIATNGNAGFGVTKPKEQVDVAGNIHLTNNGTTAIAPAGGAGTMRFNTVNNTFEGWNGSAWTPFGAGSASTGLSTVTHDASLAGDGTSGNPLKITNGTNTNDVLQWNGTNWVSAPSPGFSLPYNGITSSSTSAFQVKNTDIYNGIGVKGTGLFGVYGTTLPGTLYAAGVYGTTNDSLSFGGYFINSHAGGVALGTSGKLQFGGNNAAPNLFLKSIDNAGTAVWAPVPVGLSIVSTDNTLTGDGTPNNPLHVANSAGLTAGNGITITSNTINASSATAMWNANKIQGIDVATTTPSNGQVLAYNTGTLKYEPTTISGGGGGFWSINGNDIYNNNTGKLLLGSLNVPSGSGEIQIKPSVGAFGTGTKIWSTASYANALYVADSANSGGPIGCSACSGNNALNAYSIYGTAVFAHSPNGDGVFAASTSGNALLVDGKVKDAGSQFAMNTGAVNTTSSVFSIPTSFSNTQNDIIVITPVGGSSATNRTYMLVWSSGGSNWQIQTKDGSNFESGLSFNLIRVGK